MTSVLLKQKYLLVYKLTRSSASVQKCSQGWLRKCWNVVNTESRSWQNLLSYFQRLIRITPKSRDKLNYTAIEQGTLSLMLSTPRKGRRIGKNDSPKINRRQQPFLCRGLWVIFSYLSFIPLRVKKSRHEPSAYNLVSCHRLLVVTENLKSKFYYFSRSRFISDVLDEFVIPQLLVC